MIEYLDFSIKSGYTKDVVIDHCLLNEKPRGATLGFSTFILVFKSAVTVCFSNICLAIYKCNRKLHLLRQTKYN